MYTLKLLIETAEDADIDLAKRLESAYRTANVEEIIAVLSDPDLDLPQLTPVMHDMSYDREIGKQVSRIWDVVSDSPGMTMAPILDSEAYKSACLALLATWVNQASEHAMDGILANPISGKIFREKYEFNDDNVDGWATRVSGDRFDVTRKLVVLCVPGYHYSRQLMDRKAGPMPTELVKISYPGIDFEAIVASFESPEQFDDWHRSRKAVD